MKSYFGAYGGQFVPETLVTPLRELEHAFNDACKDPHFRKELAHHLSHFVGRPTDLYFAEKLTKHYGRAKIYLKREDMCHTGSHKLNNAIGQVLLARKLSKRRVIAETGAGQHGVATATAAALFGLECDIFMGEEDIKRQELNVYRMELLGARVIPVSSGTKTLKDATSEAMRDWVARVKDTFYIIGSVVGPYPYPLMVRYFQSVIGKETRKQMMKMEDRLPDYLVACVGGGSNAIGMFAPFFKDKKVKFVGLEAYGAASVVRGVPGVLHGMRTYLLQDKNGQVLPTHSISAGLDYPGVGPEHSFYNDANRAQYLPISDSQALKAFKLLSEKEGVIPALESAHALAHLEQLVPKTKKNEIIVVCLSGRGDKDVDSIRHLRTEKTKTVVPES